ncbi:MAG: hypothetical protein K1W24_08150 [Lachnospiraceae bacterium]
MKYLYKFILLIFTFGLSLFIFKDEIPDATAGKTIATSLQDSTFPSISLQLGKYNVNTIQGYSSELDSGNVRESITPLDTSKSFYVKITENESKIKKLSFELRDILNNKIIETNTLTAFGSDNKDKTIKIKISEALDTSTEYGMKITLTTNLSKKINFYTRIKYYENDFFLKEKLDFVENFHKATFDNGKTFNITNYLEPNVGDDSTFANITINSNYNLITWGKLKPKKLTDIIPSIKEINIETAAIEQKYYVKADTPTGTETFFIKEFYRIRYSGSRMYLLNFKRTMEALFNPEFISTKKNELKIGISNAGSLEITSSDKNNKFAFVRNGSLWYYNLPEYKLHKVFSFENKKKDLTREKYDQHDIKILKLNDDGTISFLVYGYINSGDYEGRVGIILYDYNPEDNRITERVYIPLPTTYEQLKQDLGSFCYVNNKNIFYFSLNDVVYAYNIASKKYNILTKNATKDNFVMLEKARCFVWSDASSSKYARNITILNLDTSKSLVVHAKKKQSIIVLGAIDSNIVYGYVRNKDIYEATNGEIVKPAYKLVISDCNGDILREYKNKDIYVTGATVDDNVIRLKRAKKVNGRFKPASNDDIISQKSNKKPSISITTRVTDKALTEKYISLPAGFLLEKKPSIDSTEYVMVTENTTLHLKNTANNTEKYYIYAYGGITASMADPAAAIQLADEQMGIVMDNKAHIVWERGGKFLSKELSGITYPQNNIPSIKACTQMLLQAAQHTVSASELKGSSIISMLSKYIDQPVNLTGCTLDEVLYFVSGEKPVIAMLDNSHAVLITGYTSSTITYMDPVTMHTATTSIISADKKFKDAGYVFISYVSN